MAHFAQVDESGIVRNVIVVDNKDILDKKGKESEKVGQDFIASIGLEGTFVQTSYNATFRGKYAGIGDTYDSVNDVFVSPFTQELTEVTE
jgi:hypothetical protein